MNNAISEWVNSLKIQNEDITALKRQLKLSYTIYGLMVLLSSGSFETQAWREVRDQCSSEDVNNLYESIAKHFKVTHIAINNPIPPIQVNSQEENIIRSPINFTPRYGDFGPNTCKSPPTREDFDNAFWVTAKQNGIYQTWAPRWTMFSRGNITEKARLLTLSSVLEAVEQGKADRKRCAAVDLYAGIGYFAFSYLKAGMSKVLCWDLNPWSIEGLRRGAGANKWSAAIFDECQSLDDFGDGDAELLVFSESNEYASERMAVMKDRLPPIRHVNCGLLPTSIGSLQTALDVLDTGMGGWIHVHEKFGVHEIDQKAEQIRQAFGQELAKRGRNVAVELESIHQVKSYAPGVMHCVLDLYIPPLEPP